MSDLETFGTHARRMSAAEHKPECRRSCSCRRWFCCGCVGHPMGKPTGWAYLQWDTHDRLGCPGERCEGCVTDADRALWARLADEVDAYLAHDDHEGLFA